MKSLFWFRGDLRLDDNPGLKACFEISEEVHTIYIFSKKQLNLHELAVHDVKKFQCPECEYKTTRKSSLVSHHTSMHIGQKFQCPDCEY